MKLDDLSQLSDLTPEERETILNVRKRMYEKNHEEFKKTLVQIVEILHDVIVKGNNSTIVESTDNDIGKCISKEENIIFYNTYKEDIEAVLEDLHNATSDIFSSKGINFP